MQNTGAVRDQTTYRVFWGDKETFWLAFELAELAYHFVPGYAGAIGTHTTIDGRDDFCSEHPLHMIAGPHPHQQRPAWFNGSLRTDKMHGLLDLIAPNVWATDGQWVFLEEGEAWCMRNYTARSKDEHGLATQLATMTRTASEAERMARRQVTLPPLRPLV